jgi:hypothetical protein
MRHRLIQLCLLVAAIGASAAPAFANNDVVHFGSTIQVPHDASVHDAVCFLCSVDAEGTIDGDVVVFFGNIHIAQKANKDVVNFFGNITADSDASVGKDMVSMFGSIRLGENVSVGHDMVAMFGGLHAASSASVGGNRVIFPGWLFWGPLLILGTVIYFVVHEFRAYRRRAYLRGYPYPPRQ